MRPPRAASGLLAALLGTVAILAGAAPAAAHSAEGAFLEEIGFDQRLGEQVPADLAFVNDEGRPVRVGELFRGRPAILVMLYYKCTMLCPLMLDGLVRSLKPIRTLSAGKDFQVIVVSINPREQPSLAANRKELYVERYDRPGAAAGFHFLTGEEPAIRALAKTVGFRYRQEPKRKDEFSHAAGIVLLTPQGTVARYYYGMDFPPNELQLALVEASHNTIGTLADQVLLLCYHYDPTTGTYGVAIMNLLRVAGFATVLTLGAYVAVMLRRERRPAPDAGEGS
jgi:protein SCO1/2